MSDQGGGLKRTKPLTLRERVFLEKLFEMGMNQTAAYAAMSKELGKEVTQKTCEVDGSKMRRRICQTREFSEILAARGLDAATLADDLNRLRTIQRPAFSRDGEIVGQFDDGMVQLGALKLIAESLDVVKKQDSKLVVENLTIGLPPKPEDISESPASPVSESRESENTEEGAGA